MKTQNIFKTVALLGLLASAFTAFANPDTTKLIHIPAQLSFFPPLSTNGLESGKVVNNVSVNLFAGYQGGLNGVELGGFANVIKHNMNGAQFAGFGNTVFGNANGAQFSGFYNTNLGYTKGAQFAGFANVVVDSADAIQFAGFSNVNTMSSTGIQAAGFSNVVVGNYKGGQIAAFSNTTMGSISGPQIAGFANITTGNVNGIQLAGFANVTAKDISGSQISGFINVAKKVKGSQIGFINVADSVEGASIGFLSFVKDGYRRIELEGNETFYALARAKTGTDRFYNIFIFGVTPTNDHFYWVYGYGVGTLLPVSSKLDLNFDLESFFMVQDDYRNINVNQLNRLKVNASYPISNRMEVFAGPSINLMVNDQVDENGDPIGSELTPYALNTSTFRSVTLETYFGINAGIRFF